MSHVFTLPAIRESSGTSTCTYDLITQLILALIHGFDYLSQSPTLASSKQHTVQEQQEINPTKGRKHGASYPSMTSLSSSFLRV